MVQEIKKRNFIFSEQLLEEIKKRLDKKEQSRKSIEIICNL